MMFRLSDRCSSLEGTVLGENGALLSGENEGE